MLSPDRIDTLCQASEAKLTRMRALVGEHPSALIAFSAGVDSTFVLKIAADVLGDRAVALTAISASMAPEEQTEAIGLCERLGVKLVTVSSQEIANPQYAANPQNRCYFCKTELYTLAAQKRDELGLDVIFDGFNADDFKDHRPGRQAAEDHRIVSPLAEAGLTKDEIRAWSHRLGLPTWDKPQMACLASRIPYGTSVTSERLLQLGRAESEMRRLGFKTFRVRYHGEIARLELSAEEYPRIFDPAVRREVDASIKAQGFKFVAIDLEPFRSGRINDGLAKPALALPVIQ